MPNNEYGIEDSVYDLLITRKGGTAHPERLIIGKPHPDRAKQFKPFAALRGYEQMIDEVMAKANEPHDFSDLEESC